MVIGETFAWAHMPKAGGDATAAMFELFPELVLSADERTSYAKHITFAQRSSDVEGKRRLLNIRRLPSWVLSLSMAMNRHGLYPEFEPIAMLSPHEMALSLHPDRMLSPFLEGGRAEVDRWFRMESLAEDFLAFVSELVGVDGERRRAVLNLGPVNLAGYDHELDHWFDEGHVARMYATNPLWAQIEERVYGKLLAGPATPRQTFQRRRSRLRRLLSF
ncbi:MAG: hypothetical protein ACXVZP_10690 [Gaiellaceae bacterium]